MFKVGVAVAALLALSSVAQAAGPIEWEIATKKLREEYIATNGLPSIHMVEMRDGVSLSTVVYLPRNSNATVYPAVLDRSPYGHFATELLALIFARFGFVAVMQDLRGAGMSEGEFMFWRSDGEDAYDTMAWIEEQEWSDGQVFQMGFSADGNAALAGGAFTPPQLKGQWIGWATGDGHKTGFQGGVWVESLLEGWLRGSGFPETIDEVLANEEWSAAWWDPIDIEAHPDACRWPSAHWAGWFDIFQQATIETWQYYQAETSGCPDQATLFIDAHGHCGMMDLGDLNYPLSRLALPILQAIDLFVAESGNEYGRAMLDKVNEINGAPEDADTLTFYVMGPGEDSEYANHWTTLPDFPVPEIDNWYLHADGTLSRNASTLDESSLSYVYDPVNPVPSNGGNNLVITCGQFDQRENEARDDVLVFTSEPFDTAYALTGQMWATLFVETSANDTDFTVMLLDVFPDGRSFNLADGAYRLLWRSSPTVPSLAVPGVVYEIDVDLWILSYVFEPGHALRIDVSSSNWPRFNANPNVGVVVRDQEKYSPVTATNTLHLSAEYPSHFQFPHVELSEIPKNYTPRGPAATIDGLVDVVLNQL